MGSVHAPDARPCTRVGGNLDERHVPQYKSSDHFQTHSRHEALPAPTRTHPWHASCVCCSLDAYSKNICTVLVPVGGSLACVSARTASAVLTRTHNFEQGMTFTTHTTRVKFVAECCALPTYQLICMRGVRRQTYFACAVGGGKCWSACVWAASVNISMSPQPPTCTWRAVCGGAYVHT